MVEDTLYEGKLKIVVVVRVSTESFLRTCVEHERKWNGRMSCGDV